MADGRHFEKTVKNHLSATVRPIFIKFSVMTHIDTWHHINR